MNIVRILFELLALYLLYKFIFDFIIPIYRTTKQMKGQVKNMQEKMREQEKSQQMHSTATPTQKAKREDYIDFEEIK